MLAHEVLANVGAQFELVEQDRPTKQCKDSAEERGVSEKQIVKSLIVKRESDYLHVLLPGNHELDLEQLSDSVEMASAYEVEDITGFEPGTVHPFSSDCKILIDEALLEEDKLSFTSGNPELGIIMPRTEFLRVIERRDSEIRHLSRSPNQEYEDYAEQFGIMVNQAKDLKQSEHQTVFEELVDHVDADNAVQYYKFLTRVAASNNRDLQEMDVDKAAAAIQQADSEERAKALLVDVLEGNDITDEGEFDLEELITQVVKEEDEAVNDYHSGEDDALNYLIGQVMQASKGQANPQEARELLKDALEN